MKILCRTTRLQPAVGWTQRFLFATATLMLTYCGFVFGDAWLFQRQERQQFESLLRNAPQEPAAAITATAIGPDGLIGRIEIPRLGVSVVVVEGTGSRTLRRAAGHIEGTSFPGQIGNIGVSAHRDTFFRPLRNIQRGDAIMLATLRGEYRYRVVSTNVVSPEDVGVLHPDGNEILTLVTCYPFYFVGPAPSRFIVRAERIL